MIWRGVKIHCGYSTQEDVWSLLYFVSSTLIEPWCISLCSLLHCHSFYKILHISIVFSILVLFNLVNSDVGSACVAVLEKQFLGYLDVLQHNMCLLSILSVLRLFCAYIKVVNHEFWTFALHVLNIAYKVFQILLKATCLLKCTCLLSISCPYDDLVVLIQTKLSNFFSRIRTKDRAKRIKPAKPLLKWGQSGCPILLLPLPDLVDKNGEISKGEQHRYRGSPKWNYTFIKNDLSQISQKGRLKTQIGLD